MKCVKPIWLDNENVRGEFPCGQCINCRIKKRQEWSMRCLHELDGHKKSIFVTLTYDSKLHYPQAASLEKAHLQKFIKRLRKAMEPERVRYFACGEYGEQTQRPHYHLILFGCGWDEKQLIMDCWPYANWNVPAIRKNSFGIAERMSIQYVAKYIEKKLGGELAIEEYKNKGREPIFKVSSLGIGREYCDENAKQITEMGKITVNGKPVAIPRYYLNRLGLDNRQARELARERESDFVESVTGIHVTKDVALMSMSTEDIVKIDVQTKKIRQQSEKDALASIALKTKRL